MSRTSGMGASRPGRGQAPPLRQNPIAFPSSGVGEGLVPSRAFFDTSGASSRGCSRESLASNRIDVIHRLRAHALGWLVVGNLLGLVLSGLLLFPALGRLLDPVTYGRLVPLHLDLQLYGWCALPLVALLMQLYLPRQGAVLLGPFRAPRLAVDAWSAVLAFAAVGWLAGDTSGKVFLEWSGPARIAWVAQLGLLALVLGLGLRRRQGEGKDSRLGLAARWAVLLGLLAVPFGLWMGSTGSSHPPINPETGGTTGTSVFGSTLGTAFLFCALPLLLAVRPKEPGSARHRRVLRQTLAVFAVALLAFALLDKGDVSRHDPSQLVALGALLLWPPVVGRWLARFAWPRASRPWLWASAAWGGLLVSTGLLTYLPGILQRWKFTNALVGHAHLAMAGLLTALCILIWTVLAPEGKQPPEDRDDGGAGSVFGDPLSFQLWNGGCALMILSLMVLGTVEALDPTVVHRAHPVADALYGLRLLAGLAMTAASFRWWRRSLACLDRAEAVSGSSSPLSLRPAPEAGS